MPKSYTTNDPQSFSYEDLFSREDEQASLAEILYQTGKVLNSSLNYHEALDHILDQIGRIVEHDAASIMLAEKGIARPARWRGYAQFGDPKNALMPSEVSIADTPTLREIFKTRRAVVIPYVEANKDWKNLTNQTWIKSHIGVPLQIGYQVVGFLNIDSATPGKFSRNDIGKVQVFADQAATALKNAQLYNYARQEILDRVKALKKERNFVSAILDTAGALVVTLNRQGAIVRLNRACEQISGYTFEEVKGKKFWDLFIISEELEMVTEHFRNLRERELPCELESYLLTREGDKRLIIWSNTIIPDNKNEVEYIIATGLDITERQQTEEKLRCSEERYALVALSANDGLWDWDLESNNCYFSSRWKAMLGFKEDEIGNSIAEWFDRIHPEDLAKLKADVDDHLAEKPTPFRNEHRILHRNGSYRWVLSQGLAVRNNEMQPYRMAGSQTDITQRKMTEAKLVHNAFHDGLTGLPNRLMFMSHLEQALEREREEPDYIFAVLFLDLDRFKVVNDSLGHLVGDQLLIAVARRLKTSVRSGDTVARFGGDEFAVLLNGIKDTSRAQEVANRIQAQLALPVQLKAHKIHTAASIGIALSTTGYEWPEDILRDADSTMYKAKAKGRAGYVMFDEDIRYQAVVSYELEGQLRQAIERREFQLYYQPIVSLSSNKITSVEALLRWRHPERGLLAPDKFLPLAEDTGLILPISEWVFHTAFTQAKVWQTAGYDFIRTAVNISPRQFQQANGKLTLSELIAQILQKTGLSPQSLEVEISENITTDNNELSLQNLNELSALGVHIAVDDFGIASSLGFLRDFPINTLKIDRSFIPDITKNEDDAALVKAIIAMAHSFNLRVVAEGVETEEQLTFLRSHNCDEIQGYLFSPPVPAQKLAQMLQKQQTGK